MGWLSGLYVRRKNNKPMMKNYLIYFLTVVHIGLFSLPNAAMGERPKDEDIDNAILLVHEFFRKLESGTNFSFEEGAKFFGPVVTYNMRTLVFMDLGYFPQNNRPGRPKWLKPKPSISPLGYLFQRKRELLLPKDTSRSPVYIAGQIKYMRDDELKVGTDHFFGVYIQFSLSDGSLDKLVSVRYNAVSNSLMFPFTVNGRDIAEDLGFIRVKRKPIIYQTLDPELVEELNEILK